MYLIKMKMSLSSASMDEWQKKKNVLENNI